MSARFTVGLLALWLGLACSCREPERPRVVSLSPAGTRALLALGAGESLVAVDAQSRALKELAGLPETDIGSLESQRPSLVLVPPPTSELEPSLESLRRRGISIVEIDPHSFDDAMAVYQTLADALELESAALASIRARTDALARLGAKSLGRSRPRVAPLVSVEPPVLAGGHSLVSDLLETVGADTVTHGGEESRVPARLTDLADHAPDWILVATTRPLEPELRRRLESLLAPLAPVAFLPIDPDELWLGDPLPVARELRRVLELDR